MVDQLFTILADMTSVMPIVKKSVKKSGAEAVAFMLEVITARGAKRRNDDIEVDPVKGWSGWNGACRETAALFMVSVSGFEASYNRPGLFIRALRITMFIGTSGILKLLCR